MANTTSEYLTWLFRDAGRVELRHQRGKHWTSSWHEAPDSLLATARQLHSTGNLFTSIQHVNTDKLIKPITNNDVDRYCRLFFDFDPERPVDTPSTLSELQAAQARAAGMRQHLAGHGWPHPAIGMSGNGAHLMYRTAIPNTVETRERLRLIYNGLYQRFSDDEITLDRSVRNPGRIAPLYGSVKRKGVSTADRPHRRSSINIPPRWIQVTARQVAQLAKDYTPAPRTVPSRATAREGPKINGAGCYNSLDVVAWFSAHGLYVGQLRSGVHGVRCPWSEDHTAPPRGDGGDCVIFDPDGSWPGFHCKHGHCADRNIRDVMALFGDADNFCMNTWG